MGEGRPLSLKDEEVREEGNCLEIPQMLSISLGDVSRKRTAPSDLVFIVQGFDVLSLSL